jgi:hypothetical protein
LESAKNPITKILLSEFNKSTRISKGEMNERKKIGIDVANFINNDEN